MNRLRWCAHLSAALFVLMCVLPSFADEPSGSSSSDNKPPSIFKRVTGKDPSSNSRFQLHPSPALTAGTGFFSNNKALRQLLEHTEKYPSKAPQPQQSNPSDKDKSATIDEKSFQHQMDGVKQQLQLNNYFELAKKAHDDGRWNDVIKNANLILELPTEFVANKQPFGYFFRVDAEFALGQYQKALDDCDKLEQRVNQMDPEDRTRIAPVIQAFRTECKSKIQGKRVPD